MQFGTKVDCALIIDGDDILHDSVKKSICSSEESCCIHLSTFEEINKDTISALDPKPDIIFLRIESNKPESLALLRKIKETEGIKYIPLVAVVDPGNNEQIKIAYANFANCCIELENDAGAFSSRISKVWDFWQEIAQLPPHMVPKI
jgi:hypothetical protein